MVVSSFWQGKKVLVTGHTGFKGSWLSLWLLDLGATVRGLSLEPNTIPSLFSQLGLANEVNHHIGDIRNQDLVHSTISQWKPDIIFHLAAQPLVRQSYIEPVETWNTNVMGTVHILEALKHLNDPCAAIFITTDKCYENREWLYGYRESDPLGGYDPYSSSKAAAELAISAWRRSFFTAGQIPIGIASARAGNVIGGGDWADDRIFPDSIRALTANKAIAVRNPQSTRPWQHVLEPLGGYLLLARRLYEQLLSPDWNLDRQELCGAFNFGPQLSSNRTVRSLVENLLVHWPGSWEDRSDPTSVHEAQRLNLATDKAFHTLDWQPVWGFERTVKETSLWYQQAQDIAPNDCSKFQDLTKRQIDLYRVDSAK